MLLNMSLTANTLVVTVLGNRLYVGDTDPRKLMMPYYGSVDTRICDIFHHLDCYVALEIIFFQAVPPELIIFPK